MKKMLHNLTTAIGIAFAAFLVLISVLVFLINQGWQHPIQSLHASAELRSYLEAEYPEQSLNIRFPKYNMIGNEFTTFAKDENDQVLFGLSYTIHNGITEYKVSQAKDGHYYFAGERKEPLGE